MNAITQLKGTQPSLVDITKIGLRTFVNSRTEFYDMIHEEDLYEIRDRLERETTDGWIVLVSTANEAEYVNAICTPEPEMELSLMNRLCREEHDEFKVLSSVYAKDRRKAFDQVVDCAKSLATEVQRGSETNQWFTITEDNAIAALKKAA